MKLSLPFLATLSLATAASLPATCEDIPNALGDKPQTLHDYFNQEVCQKDKCDATINESTSFLEDSVLPQLFQQFSKSLGISSGNQGQIQKVSKEVSQAIQQSCAQQYGNKKVCDDDEGVRQFGQCALKAAKPLVNQQAKKMQKLQARDDEKQEDEEDDEKEDGSDDSGVPSEEDCQKLEDVFTDDELWSKILPGYVDQFAKQCKN